MKLLDAEQIRKWDEYTIQHEPISSLDLMERAARKCTEWITSKEYHKYPVKIFCGKGNNGGDGLAIARQLLEQGVESSVFILEFGHKGTDDFQANLQRLHKLTTNIYFLQAGSALPVINKEDVVIDALFGSGINRPLQGLNADVVQHLNESGARIISIDLPSGIFLDKTCRGVPVIKANYTLTFQCLKLCLLAAENEENFGRIIVLDIGLHKEFLATISSRFQLTTKEDVAGIYRPRNQYSHKGSFGHALLIGGAEGKTGAIIIAAEACARSGAGLTSVHIMAEEYVSLNTRCPEAMTLAGNELVKKNLDKFTAIGIGPGLGQDDIAHHIVSMIIEGYEGPVVVDADAVNVLAEHQHWLTQLPANCILTPHPKEFDRLFGEHADEFSRFNTALEKTRELGCIIILKGHHTLIASKGEGYFNTTGNAGLAKGGAGDALTGIITALVAQSYQPLHAAILGVYLHGLAADIAINYQSHESLLISDVIQCIGKAFKKLPIVSK